MKKMLSVFFVCVIAFFFKPIHAQENSSGSYYSVIEINKDFAYTIEVKLPATMIPLEYVLLKGPDGLLIDKGKGIVTWKPTKTGTYIAEVVINYQGKKVGSFVIKLVVVETLGAVAGKVTNTDNKPLAAALVILYKKYSSSSKGDYFSPVLKTETDANGVYGFPRVENGTYVISAELRYDKNDPTASYPTTWHENASEIKLAKEFNISQTTPKAAINFSLKKTSKIVEPPIGIIFSSSFTLSVGEVFNYQVMEKLRAPAMPNVNYALGKFPEGMTIDAATGKVTWTPTKAGEYIAEIIVKSGSTKVAVETLKILVVEFFGSVAGVVTNEEGKPLVNIAITLNKKITVAQKDAFSSVYTVYTRADGSYSIEKVAGGEYYVYARQALEKSHIKPTEFYQSVWYVDAVSIDKATSIKVVDKNKVTVDFKLKKYVVPTPVFATVTGKVTNIESKPIANAYIVVMLDNSKTSGSVVSNNSLPNENLQTANLGTFNNVAFKAITDKDGNYKVSLPVNNKYIFASFAEGYNLQYYKETSNVLEAMKIELKTDLNSVDFKLTSLPVSKGVISGKVVNPNGAAVVSKVALITVRVDAQNKPLGAIVVRSTNTDNNGEFVFDKAANGSYLVQAIPIKEFMPAYYSSKDCGVKESKNAEQIVVKNEEIIKGLLVCVKDVRVSGGGKISGKIREANGNPLDGVIVFAESQNGDESSYAISNALGEYEIPDLSVGVYNVEADKIGFVSASFTNAVIDYAKSAFYAAVDLTMPKNNSTTDLENSNQIPAGYALNQNYPNPFNPETTISYQIPAAGFVTLKVYDVLGNEVALLVNEYQPAGVYNLKFNTSGYNLSSGIYFYTLRIANNAFGSGESIIQTRKMLLIK